MNISIFSSEKFSYLLKIMLCSLCETNNFEKHNIFIITTDMSDETENQINDILERRFEQHIQRIVIDEGMANGFDDNKNFSVASYHKLYAFKKLPSEIDRILCLDADMIIKKSLKNFYYQNMEDNILCAALDVHVSKQDRIDIGLKPEDKYVNLGCLLIDLKKYLNHYTVEEYARWAKLWKPKYVAQDVINVLYYNKIKVADQTYNFQIFSYQKFEEIDCGQTVQRELGKFSKKELKYIEDEVAILHYIGGTKPNNFRFISKTAKYFYCVMIRNGMKMQAFKIIFLNLLFRIKNRLKGD